MKQRILLLLSLASALFLCLVSCVYDDLDERDGDGNVVLVIRTASLDGRSATSEVENLNSLRVIILHADGSLEENYYVSDLGGAEQHTHLFKVSGQETKKIYLVANEESIEGVDLNDLGADPAERLEQITFTAVPSPESENPEFANGIPMSACYELTVGGEPRVEKDFYLVRAMTKFTFTFENIRTDRVTLKELEVSANDATANAEKRAFADKTYLFPRFTDGKPVASENFYVNAVGDYAPEDGQFWIDWLKEAVDKSQTDLYTPDEIGWIKDYQLPEDATHGDLNTVIASDLDTHVLAPSESWTYPQAFYRCESKGSPQEYVISRLVVKASGDVEDREWDNSPLLKLDQVKYLFRHTHVKVNVVLGQKDVVIYARIHPWEVIKPMNPLPFEPEK